MTLSSAQAARLYGLYPRKGTLLPGASDGDLAIVDIDRRWRLRAADLLYRHPWTVQEGLELRGAVVATVRRGELVYVDGQVLAAPGSGFAV